MYIFISILISALINLICFFSYNNFVNHFMNSETLLFTLGIIMSINCFIACIVHLRYCETEEKIKTKVFYKCKKEIKNNVSFLIITFIVIFLIKFLYTINENYIYSLILDTIGLSIFLLYIYAIYELTVKYALGIEPLTTKNKY